MKSRKSNFNSKEKLLTNFIQRSKNVDTYEKDLNNKNTREKLHNIDSIIKRKKEYLFNF